MFTLNDYVATLLDMVFKEKDSKGREEIIKSWVQLVVNHNREVELPKVFEILEKEFEEREEKADIKARSKEIGEKLQHFFEKKGIKTNLEISEEIIGGASVVWKNTLYDNTLRRKIGELEKKLISS